MICYRDMTFCPFHRDCRLSAECGRAYTDDVRAEAVAWAASWSKDWTEKHGVPVALFTSKPGCHTPTGATS